MAMKVMYALLVLVPIAIVMEVGDIGGHSAIFIISGLAMVPLAALLGQATEQAAFYTGPKIGALPASSVHTRSASRTPSSSPVSRQEIAGKA